MTAPGSPIPAAQLDSPDYQCKAYVAQRPDWALCNDCRSGTRRMRDMGTAYLPKAPAETEPEYLERIKGAEFYNAFGRTVRGLTGMVFRRDPVLGEDVPPVIVTQWENIDGAGTHGDVFVRQLFGDGLTDGHVAILVDYPSVANPDALTLADEREQGLRPYWVGIRASQILSWRIEIAPSGQTRLTQVVIRTETAEPSGKFGEDRKVRYRVYTRGRTADGSGQVSYAIYEEQSGQPTTVAVAEQGTMRNVTEIPLAVAYLGERLGALHTRPPLVDLAFTNVAHYQVQSDHRTSLHIASIPILVFKGRDTTQKAQPIGPHTGIDVDKEGDVKYVEHSGQALGQTREELHDLEQRMAALGLAMLQRETRAAETAEAKRIDKAEQDSALAAAARGMQDAIEQALAFHAQFLKLAGGGSVTLNHDFQQLSFEPQMVVALSNLQVANQISIDTLWDMLEAGNVLPETFDRDVERVKLLAAGPIEPPRGTDGGDGGNGGAGGNGNREPVGAGAGGAEE